MNYAISGHPRTRTAWLCALLNAHHSFCYHDAIVYKIPLDIHAGIADPGLACIVPAMALQYSEGCPRICIARADWKLALEKVTNVTIPDESAEAIHENFKLYAKHATLRLTAEELDGDGAVEEVIRECTKQPASLELIKIFQGLKIEQHLAKAQLALPPSRSV